MKKSIGIVTRELWKDILETAHELDLNKNGLYDARGGCVNIWVSSEDKPKDWRWEIRKGALNYPRAFLGTIWIEYKNENEIELFLEVTNYAKEDEAKELFEKREIDFETYKAILAEAKIGTPEEWEWLEQKAKELIEKAKRRYEIVVVGKRRLVPTTETCPVCNKTLLFKLEPNFKGWNYVCRSCFILTMSYSEIEEELKKGRPKEEKFIGFLSSCSFRGRIDLVNGIVYFEERRRRTT